MRITSSQEQWRTIIDYCQQLQFSTSTFYAVKKKLGLTSDNFVRAKITQQVEFIETQDLITVNIGKANVSLPSTTSATYLSQLLRALVL